MDLDHVTGWIGRTEQATDIVTPRLVASFRASFGPHLAPVGTGEAPLALHWCLTPPIVPIEETGPDGHAAKGGFLPPVPLPRRMWAGGRVEFHESLRPGDEVTRSSRIGDISLKEGRSGALCFVAVHHAFETQHGLSVRERHDIVYRGAPRPEAAERKEPEPAAARPSDLEWQVETGPVLLFRYSALSFNSHRIHYDHPYVTAVEGYPGLVVHGPIQATLLANLVATLLGSCRIAMDYRGVNPLIAGRTIRIRAARQGDGTVTAWTEGPDGVIHMQATGACLP